MDARGENRFPLPVPVAAQAGKVPMNSGGPMPDRAVQGDVDSIQQRLTEFAQALDFASLTEEDVNAAKSRIIDTLGAAIGGFS